ncbi:type II toxin-antitoxin system RelE/ParE family toxin [Crassaminicella profunda]|uniref:type II toxin-antitoxin system RelE/ParE family toxin n=1 Tax=Crassaminicella profunda TaxID=1286698 RepID=UPI001CA79D6B|nr:type II toxin-antitoxin system RelE/ParE family toxin [Crassaminicella profunda]QZY55780.1 type II toxin-antitoxin system RelE/ParE family toxin [Crassaminicella profunda]
MFVLIYNRIMNGTIIFYNEYNEYPVIDFIENLTSGEKAEIIRYFDLLEEYGIKLGCPYIQKIGKKHNLWQLKIPYGKKDLYFIFLNKKDKDFIFLHGFRNVRETNIKEELEVALNRTLEYEQRKEDSLG